MPMRLEMSSACEYSTSWVASMSASKWLMTSAIRAGLTRQSIPLHL